MELGHRIGHKLARFRWLSDLAGPTEAARFEILFTLHAPLTELRLPSLAHPVAIRPRSSDADVLHQVLVDRELDLPVPGEVRTVIDGGANNGITAAFFASRFPDALVIAVEPDEGNLAVLRRNTARYPNVAVVAGGLWSAPGLLRIVNPESEAWAFRCEPASDGAGFRAYTVAELLDLHGRDRCDILKLDVEGAERPILDASGGWIDRIGTLVLEAHGEAALRSAEAACPPDRWTHETRGERHVFRRRPAPPPTD